MMMMMTTMMMVATTKQNTGVRESSNRRKVKISVATDEMLAPTLGVAMFELEGTRYATAATGPQQERLRLLFSWCRARTREATVGYLFWVRTATSRKWRGFPRLEATMAGTPMALTKSSFLRAAMHSITSSSKQQRRRQRRTTNEGKLLLVASCFQRSSRCCLRVPLLLLH